MSGRAVGGQYALHHCHPTGCVLGGSPPPRMPIQPSPVPGDGPPYGQVPFLFTPPPPGMLNRPRLPLTSADARLGNLNMPDAVPNVAYTSPTLEPTPATTSQTLERTQHTVADGQQALSVSTSYFVRICHVQDGPFNFYLQLMESFDTMPQLEKLLQSGISAPLNVLIPGSVVTAKCSDGTLRRAVITKVDPDLCHVYYVDFGNDEKRPYSDIFQLPHAAAEFSPAMAMQFCLTDIESIAITPADKEEFSRLVLGKEVLINVTPRNGSFQYCELFLEGKSMRDIFIENNAPILQYHHLNTPSGNDFVYFAFGEGPGQFWVHFLSELSTILLIEAELEAYCCKQPRLEDTSSLRMGGPVAVHDCVDSKWYRGLVMKISDSKIHIFYVDYGEYKEVDISQLCLLSGYLVNKWSMQAVECCLNGFENDRNPSQHLMKKMKEIFGGRRFQLVLHSIIDTRVLCVDLIDDQGHSTAEKIKVTTNEKREATRTKRRTRPEKRQQSTKGERASQPSRTPARNSVTIYVPPAARNRSCQNNSKPLTDSRCSLKKGSEKPYDSGKATSPERGTRHEKKQPSSRSDERARQLSRSCQVNSTSLHGTPQTLESNACCSMASGRLEKAFEPLTRQERQERHGNSASTAVSVRDGSISLKEESQTDDRCQPYVSCDLQANSILNVPEDHSTLCLPTDKNTLIPLAQLADGSSMPAKESHDNALPGKHTVISSLIDHNLDDLPNIHREDPFALQVASPADECQEQSVPCDPPSSDITAPPADFPNIHKEDPCADECLKPSTPCDPPANCVIVDPPADDITFVPPNISFLPAEESLNSTPASASTLSDVEAPLKGFIPESKSATHCTSLHEKPQTSESIASCSMALGRLQNAVEPLTRQEQRELQGNSVTWVAGEGISASTAVLVGDGPISLIEESQIDDRCQQYVSCNWQDDCSVLNMPEDIPQAPLADGSSMCAKESQDNALPGKDTVVSSLTDRDSDDIPNIYRGDPCVQNVASPADECQKPSRPFVPPANCVIVDPPADDITVNPPNIGCSLPAEESLDSTPACALLDVETPLKCFIPEAKSATIGLSQTHGNSVIDLAVVEVTPEGLASPPKTVVNECTSQITATYFTSSRSNLANHDTPEPTSPPFGCFDVDDLSIIAAGEELLENVDTTFKTIAATLSSPVDFNSDRSSNSLQEAMSRREEDPECKNDEPLTPECEPSTSFDQTVDCGVEDLVSDASPQGQDGAFKSTDDIAVDLSNEFADSASLLDVSLDGPEEVAPVTACLIRTHNHSETQIIEPIMAKPPICGLALPPTTTAVEGNLLNPPGCDPHNVATLEPKSNPCRSESEPSTLLALFACSDISEQLLRNFDPSGITISKMNFCEECISIVEQLMKNCKAKVLVIDTTINHQDEVIDPHNVEMHKPQANIFDAVSSDSEPSNHLASEYSTIGEHSLNVDATTVTTDSSSDIIEECRTIIDRFRQTLENRFSQIDANIGSAMGTTGVFSQDELDEWTPYGCDPLSVRTHELQSDVGHSVEAGCPITSLDVTSHYSAIGEPSLVSGAFATTDSTYNSTEECFAVVEKVNPSRKAKFLAIDATVNALIELDSDDVSNGHQWGNPVDAEEDLSQVFSVSLEETQSSVAKNVSCNPENSTGIKKDLIEASDSLRTSDRVEMPCTAEDVIHYGPLPLPSQGVRNTMVTQAVTPSVFNESSNRCSAIEVSLLTDNLDQVTSVASEPLESNEMPADKEPLIDSTNNPFEECSAIVEDVVPNHKATLLAIDATISSFIELINSDDLSVHTEATCPHSLNPNESQVTCPLTPIPEDTITKQFVPERSVPMKSTVEKGPFVYERHERVPSFQHIQTSPAVTQAILTKSEDSSVAIESRPPRPVTEFREIQEAKLPDSVDLRLPLECRNLAPIPEIAETRDEYDRVTSVRNAPLGSSHKPTVPELEDKLIEPVSAYQVVQRSSTRPQALITVPDPLDKIPESCSLTPIQEVTGETTVEEHAADDRIEPVSVQQVKSSAIAQAEFPESVDSKESPEPRPLTPVPEVEGVTVNEDQASAPLNSTDKPAAKEVSEVTCFF